MGKNAQTHVWYNATHNVDGNMSMMRCKPELQRRLLTVAKTGSPATETADHSMVECIPRHDWSSQLLKVTFNANH